jgi:hypothetical protein
LLDHSRGTSWLAAAGVLKVSDQVPNLVHSKRHRRLGDGRVEYRQEFYWSFCHRIGRGRGVKLLNHWHRWLLYLNRFSRWLNYQLFWLLLWFWSCDVGRNILKLGCRRRRVFGSV